MNTTTPIPRPILRLSLLGAIVVHLVCAAIGPWAHATWITHGGPDTAAAHPGEPHAEVADPGHFECALCALADQPKLPAASAPPPETLLLPATAARGDVPTPPSRRGLSAPARAPPPLRLASMVRA